MRSSFLVVEDQQDIREYLELVLSDSGDVVGAESGEEALALARANRVDVALCDFVLPGLRGFDLIRELQSLQDPPTVILVTGYADEHLIAQAQERGVFAVFGKPFDLQALLDTVDEALRARSVRASPRETAPKH